MTPQQSGVQQATVCPPSRDRSERKRDGHLKKSNFESNLGAQQTTQQFSMVNDHKFTLAVLSPQPLSHLTLIFLKVFSLQTLYNRLKNDKCLQE